MPIGGGLTGIGCVGSSSRRALHWAAPLGSSIPKTGFPVTRVENVHVTGSWRRARGSAFDGPFTTTSRSAGGDGKSFVPQVVMHRLEIPLQLASVGLEGNQRVAVEIVAEPITAPVVVRTRRLDGDIEKPASASSVCEKAQL